MAGRCLGAQGIEKLAVALQDYFISSGFVTTRVEIPSQDLTTHHLILKVVPGRIDKIIIQNNDVRHEILPFATGDILNIRDIEQGLENLQGVPGVNVKVDIAPGERNGYSNVVIATNRSSNWNVRASYNNWGDKTTGQQLAGGAGYLYNPARINDIFICREHAAQRENTKALAPIILSRLVTGTMSCFTVKADPGRA